MRGFLPLHLLQKLYFPGKLEFEFPGSGNKNCPDMGREDGEMLNLIKKFVKEDDGATMVEYGLMVALVAAVSVGIVTLLGTNVCGIFQTISDAVDTAS